MKRTLVLLLALCLIFSLAACGSKDTNSDVSGNISQTESTDTLGENETTPSSESETATTPALPFDVEEGLFYGGNALALTDKGISGLTANRILNRSSWEIFHGYVFDNMQTVESKDWSVDIGTISYHSKQYAVPENIVYQFAAMFFNIDSAAKELLKESDRYDSAKRIYWIYSPDLWFQGYDAIIKGYESLGNDEYILYAQAIETNHVGAPHSECATTEACIISKPCFKARIKATGANSYIVTSFDYIDKIPSNIAK